MRRPNYKMLGRDIIHGGANGRSYFGKCFVKYISHKKGQYMGILTDEINYYPDRRNVYHETTFNNEYTNKKINLEPATSYIFVPCKQMLLEKIKSDSIRIGTDIDNIYQLVVQQWFLVDVLEETTKDPVRRGGYRKSKYKKRLTRRKSVHKLKRDG